MYCNYKLIYNEPKVTHVTSQLKDSWFEILLQEELLKKAFLLFEDLGPVYMRKNTSPARPGAKR